jgi:hypothetical protein
MPRIDRQNSISDELDKSANNSVDDSTHTDIAATWNHSQETMLKAISERANCMRWLHNECNIHFENLNFYFTIPNVIISTLNGSFTMSLGALFPEQESQRVAQTIIGLISIFSAILITMNQYVKSQQMAEAHRAAGLAYGKMYRNITNELSLRSDQRTNGVEFMKLIRAEQDRLESTAPIILQPVIKRFNEVFKDRNIEKPEIAGDLDETHVNTDIKGAKGRGREGGSPLAIVSNALANPIKDTFSFIKSRSDDLFTGREKRASAKKDTGAPSILYEDKDAKALTDEASEILFKNTVVRVADQEEKKE